MNKLFRYAALPAAVIGLVQLSACSEEEATEVQVSVEQAVQQAPVAKQLEPLSKAPEKSALRSFFDENYSVDMARYPTTASYRGIKTNQGQWNNYSVAFMDESRTIDEARLAQLQSFDRSTLSDAEALSYDLTAVG